MLAKQRIIYKYCFDVENNADIFIERYCLFN